MRSNWLPICTWTWILLAVVCLCLLIRGAFLSRSWSRCIRLLMVSRDAFHNPTETPTKAVLFFIIFELWNATPPLAEQIIYAADLKYIYVKLRLWWTNRLRFDDMHSLTCFSMLWKRYCHSFLAIAQCVMQPSAFSKVDNTLSRSSYMQEGK